MILPLRIKCPVDNLSTVQEVFMLVPSNHQKCHKDTQIELIKAGTHTALVRRQEGYVNEDRKK